MYQIRFYDAGIHFSTTAYPAWFVTTSTALRGIAAEIAVNLKYWTGPKITFRVFSPAGVDVTDWYLEAAQ